MWTARLPSARLLALPLALVVALAWASSASAAPVMCTSYGANPRGVTATHLFAKIDGAWVEPENVCVSVTIAQSGVLGGFTTRNMTLGVWNTVDGGFPETHLPPGTQISLGLRRPPGMMLQSTSGIWRNAVVLSAGLDTVIQGRTAPWDYHNEAFFGGGLDCGIEPVRWPSTFTASATLNPINADGTPNFASEQYAGGFYESNSIGATFPRLNTDAFGNPTGLEVRVTGCGDQNPSTLEGYFDGFTPVSFFRGFGISDELLRDAALLQRIIEVRDARTNALIQATFAVVGAGELSLEPVPGTTLPSPPAGPGIIGVRTTSAFSYSEHVLVQRGRPGAMRTLRRCRAKGGRPSSKGGRLTCIPDTTRPRAKLLTGRSLSRGKPLLMSCNEPCRVVASVVAGGRRLATGRRTSTKAGRLKVPLKLTAAGRTRLASEASVRAILHVTVRDRAGNKASLKRGLRLTRR